MDGQAAPGAEKTKTWANFRHAAAQSKTPQKIKSRLPLNEMKTDADDTFCNSVKQIHKTGRCQTKLHLG